MLLRLAPGLRLVRRGVDHVQVGLLDSRRVVLPRTGATAHVIDEVLDLRPLSVAEPGVLDVARRLVDSGCAHPVEMVEETSGASPPGVGLLESGGAMPTDVRGRLRDAGLAPRRVDETGVTLVLAVGEPAREPLDPLVRGGRPHLVLRLVDGAVLVGPFVVPGLTACLRCLDAHAVDEDPDHLPVLTRYIAASQVPRGDGVEDLPDPVLVELGLAMAVRDLRAGADGGRPITWSTTVQLGPEIAHERRHAWERHPECGCSWPGAASSSGRMEA